MEKKTVESFIFGAERALERSALRVQEGDPQGGWKVRDARGALEGRKEACAFGASARAVLVRARMLFGVEHIWRVAPTIFFELWLTV